MSHFAMLSAEFGNFWGKLPRAELGTKGRTVQFTYAVPFYRAAMRERSVPLMDVEPVHRIFLRRTNHETISQNFRSDGSK